MEDFLFIFGRNPELSFLELITYLESRTISYEIQKKNNYGIILSVDTIDTSQVVSSLGGIVKIGKILFQGDVDEFEHSFKDTSFSFVSNKIFLGMSVYGRTPFDVEYIRKYLFSLLKEQHYKVVFKKFDREGKISPTRLQKIDFLKNGIELLIFGTVIAQTIAISDISQIKFRDLHRPRNDFLKNISIRMAKILINISGVKEKEYLLDPFCGTGVILQEGLLQGVYVVGVDNDQKSVQDSLENLEWIKKTYDVKPYFKVFHMDVRNLHFDKNLKFDAIVTEPFMGPYIKKLPPFSTALKIIKELENLYSSFFRNIKPYLKKSATLVFVVPQFKTIEKKRVTIRFKNVIEPLGFRIKKTLSSNPLIYSSQKDSKIIRQIFILSLS